MRDTQWTFQRHRAWRQLVIYVILYMAGFPVLIVGGLWLLIPDMSFTAKTWPLMWVVSGLLGLFIYVSDLAERVAPRTSILRGMGHAFHLLGGRACVFVGSFILSASACYAALLFAPNVAWMGLSS